MSQPGGVLLELDELLEELEDELLDELDDELLELLEVDDELLEHSDGSFWCPEIPGHSSPPP